MTVASSVLDRFITSVDEDELGVYRVHVLVDDQVAQHRWQSDDRENIYSASQGVCSLAIGIALDESILSLETWVSEMLPGMELDAGVEAVTVRHLLTMSSGIAFAWFGDEPVLWSDLAQGNATKADVRPRFGVPIHRRQHIRRDADVGSRCRRCPRLADATPFDPLGIDNPAVAPVPLGWIVGELRTGELVRIGRVLRDRG